MAKETFSESVPLPQGVTASVSGKQITITGPKGSLTRDFAHPQVQVSAEKGITFKTENPIARVRTQIYTNCAHLRNMIKGVQQGHKYQLKICSGHFPMTVTVTGTTVTVKNFLGGKVPLSVDLPQAVKIVVNGDIIDVEATDVELAGNAAARIESITRITNKDRRIFQDGIYITKKAKEFN